LIWFGWAIKTFASRKIMLAFAGRILNKPTGWIGFAGYTLALAVFGFLLPRLEMDNDTRQVVIFAGSIALWRYSWGLIHYARFLIYTRLTFPRMRANVPAISSLQLYILITSYRIDPSTSISVFRSSVEEAILCGFPTTIVCSFVELSDEILMKKIYADLQPPEQVKILFVRIAGSGKRDGLAHGFRAIARLQPSADALVIVQDGDSILSEGLIDKCAPFFADNPKLGALTTDEECIVHGSRLMREWHHLRFSQRQILMASMALSRRVLTLTGRMSMFRASIITNAQFIETIENDSIHHWRLGTFKFLTGDDKSSWFWVLKNDYEMLYVPDAVVITEEHPPARHFVRASSMLMVRWFGNMLRTNGRALALGPSKTGFFTWWCLLDQRLSMWTSMIGPVVALMLSLKHSILILPAYLFWIGATRWIMAVMLLASRPVISWHYPFLIYYNQVWGAILKTYAFFHLDRQSWTRQKIVLNREMKQQEAFWLNITSNVVHGISFVVFVAVIGFLSGVLTLPNFSS
jgi:glycosyltransferase Alg8